MKRILVVDDDVIICGDVKLFLEKRGYEVETAYSCKGADGCLEHGFDLILLDRKKAQRSRSSSSRQEIRRLI